MTAALVGAWAFLAPTSVGGSTSYITTHGASMAPRFKTGDLALVRRADRYKVGQVAAYRSSVLRTVVMHRIIARQGDRYVFKGDANDFVDPSPPQRAQLIGALWLRIPSGGRVLGLLPLPVIAGALAAVLLLSIRSRSGGHRAMPGIVRRADPRALLVTLSVAAAAFLALGLVAFTRSTTKPVTVKTRYDENVRFGYDAAVGAGPVYPDGSLRTGDPVFLRLVRNLRVEARYDVATVAPHRLTGTQEVSARLTSSNGWSRTLELAPRTRFTGTRATAEATLDLQRLRGTIRRVELLTGAPSGTYTVAVVPRFHVTGTLAGRPLDSAYAPALNFQLDALQLRPEAEGAEGFAPVRRGAVSGPATVPARLSWRGHALEVASARWIAPAGFLLAALGAALAGAWLVRRPADPGARIRATYRHLIIPVAGFSHDAGRPPVDVTSIDALVRLAERRERVILHHQGDGRDSYLVDDEGILYRYQAQA
jgi:signal peptidase I